MKEVKMTDEQMEVMAPGEYTTWEKRVWRRGYEAALSQQPEARGVVDARRIAVGLWQRHYREVAPEWEPFDDLPGLLSQIDNMVSGLTRAPAVAQQPAAVQQRGQAEFPPSEYVGATAKVRDCNCQRYNGRDCRKCFNPPYPDEQPMQQGQVVDSIEANDSADYIELCVSRLESFGKLVMAETLRAIAAEHRALAQPPACKSRIEQVAQEVLAEHEGDEAFDFLKAVVGKIVARATR